MFFNQWAVLLVDDEPDVLKMSKILMRKFEVYGLPLKIYTAESKTEAVQLMKDNLEVASALAVAFIDVVMESDTAGLELCQYIRQDIGNPITQLYIRTGQPGLFSETDVVNEYDINGYFTKIDTTQAKLYSLIKSGIRQYLSFGMSLSTINLLSSMVHADNQGNLLDSARDIGGYSIGLEDTPRWLFVEEQLLFEDEVDSHQGYQHRNQFSHCEGLMLHPAGDRYITDENGLKCIYIAPQNDHKSCTYIFQTHFDPPDFIIKTIHNVMSCFSTTWHRLNEEKV